MFPTLHVSGLHSTPNDVVRAAVAVWATEGFAFISHTEASGHRDALRADGYQKAQDLGSGGRGECALMVATLGWKVRSYRTVALSDLGIPRRGGQLCYALLVEVEHSEHGRHTVIVIHLPSGVEGLHDLQDNEQARVYRDCIAGLRRLVASIDGPVRIIGDWNLDLKLSWVRAYLSQHFPAFAWTVIPVGEPGTHGDRRIDFALQRGFTSTGDVMSSRQTSDHRAVAERVTRKEPTVTKGIYPAAKQLPIPPGDNDPPIVPRIAVLHVDAGNAESLFTFFRDRSGGVESHFHVRKDGVVEQYRNIFRQADANLRANDFAVSIETQGLGAGTWNAAQLAAIKALLVWLNREAAIPLIRCTAWNGKGVGYHVMFGAPGPWTPVAKSCPGPDRIKQYEAVIIPWMKGRTNPTRVEQARALLGAAHARALAAGRTKRAAAIRAALKALPAR